MFLKVAVSFLYDSLCTTYSCYFGGTHPSLVGLRIFALLVTSAKSVDPNLPWWVPRHATSDCVTQPVMGGFRVAWVPRLATRANTTNWWTPTCSGWFRFLQPLIA